ncbi:MAG: zinc ribbon domain-containing protein [Phycisphaerales bacterium]
MAEDSRRNKGVFGRAVGRRRLIFAGVLGGLATLLACVWVYSGWSWITFGDDQSPPTSFSVAIYAGGFAIDRETPPRTPGGQTALSTGPREWYVDWTAYESGEYTVKLTKHWRLWIALWPLALCGYAGAAALLWSVLRSRARLRVGRCHRCGYAMVKQQSGEREGELVCPECGPEVQKARRARGRIWKITGVMLTGIGAVLFLTWAVSGRWKLAVMTTNWECELKRGAVDLRRREMDPVEPGDWRWEELESGHRGLEWRANCNGTPNGPTLWSWEMSWDTPDRLAQFMIVLWPWWLLTVGIGVWMQWPWRRGGNRGVSSVEFFSRDHIEELACEDGHEEGGLGRADVMNTKHASKSPRQRLEG